MSDSTLRTPLGLHQNLYPKSKTITSNLILCCEACQLAPLSTHLTYFSFDSLFKGETSLKNTFCRDWNLPRSYVAALVETTAGLAAGEAAMTS